MLLTHLIELCRSAVQSCAVLLLQSSIVLLLGLGLGWAMRRRGPLAQTLVYRATLLAVMGTMAFSPLFGGGSRAIWRVSLPSPPVRTSVMELPAVPTSAVDTLPMTPTPQTTAPALASAPAPSGHSDTSAIGSVNALYVAAAGLWGLGTAALLVWLGVGQCSLALLRRRSTRIEAGEAAEVLQNLGIGRRAPTLRTSPHVRSPFLAGLWRPTIFLPASYATDFDGPALRAILAHELAHLGRRDTLWIMFARLLCALLWPQPLLWALTRRMEHAAEEDCDARALAQGCSPRAYADCLLSLAERAMPSRLESRVGVSVLPFRSALGQRISAILHKERPPMSAISRCLSIGVSLGALASTVLGLALVSAGIPPSATLHGTSAAQQDRETRCLDHVRAISQALLQYAHDHDQRLPQAVHWTDDIRPYVSDPAVFHDPGARPSQRWSYAFNRNLSGVRLNQIEAPSSTVLVFESETDYILEPPEGTKNASDHGETVPKISRHGGYAVFGFADGHVGAFPNAQKPSFRVRTTQQSQAAPAPHPSVPGTDAQIRPNGQDWRAKYLTSLAVQIAKAKQDVLDFERAHPKPLSPTQAAQIKRLFDLRLERNDIALSIRNEAVIRAKHVTRLQELGPSPSAERRKWEQEITRIDAQTRQWSAQVPGLQTQIAQLEMQVAPFSADYVELQRRKQKYAILRSEYQVFQQVAQMRKR